MKWCSRPVGLLLGWNPLQIHTCLSSGKSFTSVYLPKHHLNFLVKSACCCLQCLAVSVPPTQIHILWSFLGTSDVLIYHTFICIIKVVCCWKCREKIYTPSRWSPTMSLQRTTSKATIEEVEVGEKKNIGRTVILRNANQELLSTEWQYLSMNRLALDCPASNSKPSNTNHIIQNLKPRLSLPSSRRP